MTILKKVVIPIAGLGTRMYPATKVIPKEMLPLAGKPIIEHIIDEVCLTGFKEVILVVNSKNSLSIKHLESLNYLRHRPNKYNLNEKNKLKKINILIVKQKEAKGLGDAILCAKKIIKKEPFVVLLPDMVIDGNFKNDNLSKMKKNYEEKKESSILLSEVNKKESQKYGIASFENKKLNDIFFPLKDIVEKPLPKNAPSNLFAAGRYVFDNEILNFLSQEKPDSKGEIQLTGAIKKFLKHGNTVNGILLQGSIFDCGNKLNYLIANIAFSFKDKKIKKEVLKYFKK